MPQAEEVAAWRGRRVVDPSGDEIGKLEDIYLDDDTGEPEWALIGTSLFAGRSPFVPLAGAEAREDVVQVRFAKDQVKDAPSVKAGEELSQEQEAQLYAHYGLEYSFVPSPSGMAEGQPGAGGGGEAGTTGAAGAAGAAGAVGQPGGAGAPGTQGEADAAGGAGAHGGSGTPGDADTAGATSPATTPAGAEERAAETHDAGAAGAAGAAAAMQPGGGGGAAGTTPATETGAAGTADTPEAAGAAAAGAGAAAAGEADEDDVRVRARAQPRERVRLRKYLVTEHVTKTVPVQREEVRVEREPIEGGEADAQEAGAPGDQEVTLTHEEAVVEPSTRREQQSE